MGRRSRLSLRRRTECVAAPVSASIMRGDSPIRSVRKSHTICVFYAVESCRHAGSRRQAGDRRTESTMKSSVWSVASCSPWDRRSTPPNSRHRRRSRPRSRPSANRRILQLGSEGTQVEGNDDESTPCAYWNGGSGRDGSAHVASRRCHDLDRMVGAVQEIHAGHRGGDAGGRLQLCPLRFGYRRSRAIGRRSAHVRSADAAHWRGRRFSTSAVSARAVPAPTPPAGDTSKEGTIKYLNAVLDWSVSVVRQLTLARFHEPCHRRQRESDYRTRCPSQRNGPHRAYARVQRTVSAQQGHQAAAPRPGAPAGDRARRGLLPASRDDWLAASRGGSRARTRSFGACGCRCFMAPQSGTSIQVPTGGQYSPTKRPRKNVAMEAARRALDIARRAVRDENARA